MKSSKDRFLCKAEKRGKNECWEWRGSRLKSGYGQFKSEIGGLAHRFSYHQFHGPIPAGALVMHSCDNPGCVNPAHLSVGTPSDNVQDMMRKQRHNPARGVRAGKARLNPVIVRQLRERRAEGDSWGSLAKAFGIGATTAQKVCGRVTWAHVD